MTDNTTDRITSLAEVKADVLGKCMYASALLASGSTLQYAEIYYSECRYGNRAENCLFKKKFLCLPRPDWQEA